MRRARVVYAWRMAAGEVLTVSERRLVRDALLTELARAREQAIVLSAQFADIVAAAELSNADDEHDPEGTTIAFERAQVAALLDQVRRDETALQHALAGVDDPGFGACERCAGPIGLERLVALPASRVCVACAR